MTNRNRPRCLRCRATYKGSTKWGLEFEEETVIGLICPNCLTEEQRAEISVRRTLGQKLILTNADGEDEPDLPTIPAERE